MKGVTLAVAGVSLLEIAVRHWAFGRLLLWVVAFAGAVLTYYAATAGAALLNKSPSLPDVLFPMLLSVSELMLIARPGFDLGTKAEWIPTDWFALLAAWSAQCGCVIVVVSRGLRSGIASHAYSKDVASIVENYRIRLRPDYRGAFGSSIVSLVIFLLWRLDLVSAARPAKAGAALIMLGSIVYGIYNQRVASREIDASLKGAQKQHDISTVAS